MAKRFTDIDIWDKEWFRLLPPKYKCFWKYICDKCNQVGVWEVSVANARHFIGAPIDLEEAKRIFAEQILPIEGGRKWYLTGFIQFQYGELTPTNNFHKSLIAGFDRLSPALGEAKRSGAGEPLLRGSKGPQDIYKDKDKVKDKEDGSGKKQKHLDFVWLTEADYKKLADRMGHHLQPFIERLNGYIGQIGEKKAAAKYTSHYHTILNWYRKDIEDGKIRPPQSKPKPKPPTAPLPEPDLSPEELSEMHRESARKLGPCRDPECNDCYPRSESEVANNV